MKRKTQLAQRSPMKLRGSSSEVEGERGEDRVCKREGWRENATFCAFICYTCTDQQRARYAALDDDSKLRSLSAVPVSPCCLEQQDECLSFRALSDFFFPFERVLRSEKVVSLSLCAERASLTHDDRRQPTCLSVDL